MTLAELEESIAELEVKIDRIRSLYEQFFLGIERLEPQTLRKEIERKLALLRREKFRNTALRFRFQQILQRFTTYQNYWQRVMRQIDEGTYRRDVMKTRQRLIEQREIRRRQRRGELPPAEGEKASGPEGDELEVEVDALLELDDRPPADEGRDSYGERDSSLEIALAFDALTLEPEPRRAIPKPAPPEPILQFRPPASGPQPRLPRASDDFEKTSFEGPPSILRGPPKPVLPPPVPGPRAGPELPHSPPRATGGRPLGSGATAQPSREGAPAEPKGATPASAPKDRTSDLRALFLGEPPSQPGPAQGVPSRPTPAPPSVGGLGSVPSARSSPPQPARVALPPPPPVPAGRPPGASAPAGGLSRERMRELHERYNAQRRMNREPEVGLEAVERSIAEMMPRLQAKAPGRRVDFEVEVKDGKTILRPVAK